MKKIVSIIFISAIFVISMCGCDTVDNSKKQSDIIDSIGAPSYSKSENADRNDNSDNEIVSNDSDVQLMIDFGINR